MLSLSRKKGQTIVIATSDGPITITVTDRGRTRLKLSAPAKCRILRGELIAPAPSQEIKNDE